MAQPVASPWHWLTVAFSHVTSAPRKSLWLHFLICRTRRDSVSAFTRTSHTGVRASTHYTSVGKQDTPVATAISGKSGDTAAGGRSDGKRAAPTQHHRHRRGRFLREHWPPPATSSRRCSPSPLVCITWAPLPPPTCGSLRCSGGGARTPPRERLLQRQRTLRWMNLLGVRTNFRVIPLIISS